MKTVRRQEEFTLTHYEGIADQILLEKPMGTEGAAIAAKRPSIPISAYLKMKRDSHLFPA